MIIKRYSGLMSAVLACACILVLLLISCQPSQPLPTQSLVRQGADASPTPDVSQSTAQEAVLSYYQAVNEGNSELMAKLLDASDESNQRFLEGFKDSLKADIQFNIENVRIYIIEQDEKWTRIRTNHYQKLYLHGDLIAAAESGEEMTLINKEGRWYFVGMGDLIPPGWLFDEP